LYGQSDNAAKKEKGKAYLKQVTKQQPEDVEAWIELAKLMQHTEKVEALKAYTHAITIIKSQFGAVNCPELLDNVGCLHHQLKQFEKARDFYKLALVACDAEKAKATEKLDINYYEGISVTVRYNLARLFEGAGAELAFPCVMEVTAAYEPADESGFLPLAVGQTVSVSRKADGSYVGTVLKEDAAAATADECPVNPASMEACLVSTAPTAKHMYEQILAEYVCSRCFFWWQNRCCWSRMQFGSHACYWLEASIRVLQWNMPLTGNPFLFDHCHFFLWRHLTPRHDDYSDCYMRLGCIERDAGRHREADAFYKQGLRFNKLDAWTLLGNMNMVKKEYNPAQKKFEQILNDRESKDDPYSMLSLGNIWLDWAPSASAEKQPVYLKRAFDHYRAVLLKDPHNVYASHGIGCVFALQGRLNEAKDIFIQVREASIDTPEPWLNLAHIYCAQKSFENGVKLYENCLKKFFPEGNATVLSYLAAASLRAGKPQEAEATLLEAQKLSPTDTMIKFNIGLCQLSAARLMLERDDQKLATVDEAMTILRNTRQLFGELKTLAKQKFTPSAAEKEERRANDFLQSAKQRKGRVEKVEGERVARETDLALQKQTFQQQLDADKQAEAAAKVADKAAKEERIQTFQKEVVEKGELLNIEIAKKEKREPKKRKQKDDDDMSGGSDDDTVVGGEVGEGGEAAPKPKKKQKRVPKEKKEKKTVKAKKKGRIDRKGGSDSDDSDSDGGIVTGDGPAQDSKKASSRPGKSFKSKAVIDSDEDD
jgi:tetratricopeptide (TPR) repeat protein